MSFNIVKYKIKKIDYLIRIFAKNTGIIVWQHAEAQAKMLKK